MQEENNYKVRLGIVLLLSIIASILMVIFTIPKANALVQVNPNTTTSINGTTFYGYNIPTRPNPTEFGTGLKLGVTARAYSGVNTDDFYLLSNAKHEFGKSNNFHFDLLDNYVSDNDISLSNLNYNMTKPIRIESIGPALLNYTWTFNMGRSSSTSDMLADGQFFDYTKYYSFEYDIVLFDSNLSNGHLGKKVDLPSSSFTPTQSTNFNGFLAGGVVGGQLYYSTLGPCSQYPENNPTLWSCSSGNYGYGYTVQTIYSDYNLQVLHYTVLFNQYSKFRFSEDLNYSSSSNNGQTAFTGVNQNVNNELLGVNYFNNVNNRVLNYSDDGLNTAYTYLMVSVPYNIVMWTNNSSEFCQGNSCWTQSDTDSIDNIKTDSGNDNFITDFLNVINGILGKDYGFSGIVNLTFDFITGLLNSVKYNNTCYVASVSFFGKNIVLPCGKDFWKRPDLNTFNVLYNTIFIGALSYLLAWKIYKDILNAISPSSKIVNGSEVDSL